MILIELVIIYVCHQLPFAYDFRKPRTPSGLVSFLYILYDSFCLCYTADSHTELGRKGGGRACRLCVSVFMWVLAVFLHCFLS